MVHTKKQHKHKKIPKLISSKALFKAVEDNNITGIEYLLEHGVPLNTPEVDFYNRTPLYWAVCKKNEQMVRLILNKGADCNIQDGVGLTPLGWAVYLGFINIAKILLENNADVNSKNCRGITPLCKAIIPESKINFNIVKLLLQYGASLTAISTKTNKTPLDYIEGTRIDSKALLNLEQLYRNKELPKIAEKTYIKKTHIQDFVKWKAEAEIPKYIKSNRSLLSENVQKLFALNKFLQNNSSLVSNEVTKLLEEKIKKYIGYQDLVETKQPIFTLKHFSTLKIIQNPEECSKHFADELPLHTIEIIEQLEQDYRIKLNGVTEGN
ncbi:ankyrin repeat domain-containing protein [Rickettsia endosymbiont of Halotydeus destructor]|uniref:ankyrin repeat domain-containing protein n=1 Tax=Rickettsia endosymbiont of Halotydeus destructor TaxID=2996754 RepID=UPI003BB07B2D